MLRSLTPLVCQVVEYRVERILLGSKQRLLAIWTVVPV
jgi:hypothetical protein